jgi:membrane-associated phospholipid phosphatase
MIVRPSRIIVSMLCISSYCAAQAVHPSLPDSGASSLSRTTGVAVAATGAVAVTAIMINNDQRICDNLHDWRMKNRIAGKVSPGLTNLGDGKFAVGLFSGFLGYGLVFKDNKAFEAGKIGMESFILTGITAQIFKHLCGRERPSTATRPGGFWHGPTFRLRKFSGGESIASFDAFPSGHTITAFSAATTISDFYTEPWVSYTCYSAAGIVAITRVMERAHWMSDCFVGAFIGYYGTKLVERLNYGSGDITLAPRADERQYGLTFAVHL